MALEWANIDLVKSVEVSIVGPTADQRLLPPTLIHQLDEAGLKP
jgi:hypothetical protein